MPLACGSNKVFSDLLKKLHSILADESTDMATIEELSICFRRVDSSGSPVEHFLGLVSLSACGAASIFAALKAFLADSDIDAGKLRGQGYDGAATFSGTKNGVQMRIIGTTSIVCAL